MGRILAIDYGLKRCGLAVTDPQRIIASPLDTVPAENILPFLDAYFRREQVDILVVGLPVNTDGRDTQSTGSVRAFIDQLRKRYPELEVHTEDERFTSKIAFQAMIAGGVRKKDRRDKAMVDKLSATIILQSFLERTGR